LISGDLTWQGAREEYEWATEFISDVKSWARLTASQVLICPGNHDLVFPKEPWTKGTLAAKVTESSLSEYKRFYEQLFEIKPSEDLSYGRRFWSPDGAMIDVASLNTSLLQQIAGAFQGNGFVGPTQLIETAKSMMWSGDRLRTKAYRIACCIITLFRYFTENTQKWVQQPASCTMRELSCAGWSKMR
jgi:hypothetical protein